MKFLENINSFDSELVGRVVVHPIIDYLYSKLKFWVPDFIQRDGENNK